MSGSSDLSGIDERTLVGNAQQGSLEGFEELVARHRDKVYGRAFSLVRNEDEALDLSQRAWIKAWQRLAQFQGGSSFATWLSRIVINLCLDHLRAQKRFRAESIDEMQEQFEDAGMELPAIYPNFTEGIEQAELRQRIDQALAQLSPAHRTVLVLHEFERLEYKEVAERMDCSIGTVMSRLFYARRKMAVLLADLKRERNP